MCAKAAQRSHSRRDCCTRGGVCMQQAPTACGSTVPESRGTIRTASPPPQTRKAARPGWSGLRELPGHALHRGQYGPSPMSASSTIGRHREGREAADTSQAAASGHRVSSHAAGTAQAEGDETRAHAEQGMSRGPPSEINGGVNAATSGAVSRKTNQAARTSRKPAAAAAATAAAAGI